MENKKVLVLTLRQVDGRVITSGYTTSYGRMCEFFWKTKNPREKGYRQINVYFNTEEGHEFYGWSASSAVSHYSFDFQIDFDEMYKNWIEFWK